MLKAIQRATLMLFVLSALALSTPASRAEGQTVKVDTRQAIQLILKMSPAGGKLVVETGGTARDELTVRYPAESGATLSQAENVLTLRGQSRPSTYTVRVPGGGLEMRIEVNGKQYHIEQGAGSVNRYEFQIK